MPKPKRSVIAITFVRDFYRLSFKRGTDGALDVTVFDDHKKTAIPFKLWSGDIRSLEKLVKEK